MLLIDEDIDEGTFTKLRKVGDYVSLERNQGTGDVPHGFVKVVKSLITTLTGGVISNCNYSIDFLECG